MTWEATKASEAAPLGELKPGDLIYLSDPADEVPAVCGFYVKHNDGGMWLASAFHKGKYWRECYCPTTLDTEILVFRL